MRYALPLFRLSAWSACVAALAALVTAASGKAQASFGEAVSEHPSAPTVPNQLPKLVCSSGY